LLASSCSSALYSGAPALTTSASVSTPISSNRAAGLPSRFSLMVSLRGRARRARQGSSSGSCSCLKRTGAVLWCGCAWVGAGKVANMQTLHWAVLLTPAPPGLGGVAEGGPERVLGARQLGAEPCSWCRRRRRQRAAAQRAASAGVKVTRPAGPQAGRRPAWPGRPGRPGRPPNLAEHTPPLPPLLHRLLQPLQQAGRQRAAGRVSPLHVPAPVSSAETGPCCCCCHAARGGAPPRSLRWQAGGPHAPAPSRASRRLAALCCACCVRRPPPSPARPSPPW
jgi:hypothetical protein